MSRFGCYERDIEKLEKIQLEAARIVTGLTKFASKVVNLRVSRRLAKVSHPVSKYNESLLANFVRPVTIRAASNCIFSNFN
jgi:hypothetical protein